MSIIEDALKKAQNIRATGTPNLPSAFPPHERVGGDRAARRKTLRWVVFVTLMGGIGASVWWGLDVYEKAQREQLARDFSSRPLGGESPSPLPSLDETATEEGAPALAEEPLELPMSDETPLPADGAPRAEAAAPASVPTEEAAPEVPPAPVANRTPPAVVPADPTKSPFAPEEKPAPAPGADFVAEGWKILTKGDAPAAISRWEKGLADAPADRLAFVASVYTLRMAALKKVREVGAERYGLVVKGVYQENPAYYLLVYPPDEQLFAIQQEVMERLGLKALKGNRLAELRTKIALGAPPAEEPSAPEAVAKREAPPAPVAQNEPAPTPAPTVAPTVAPTPEPKGAGRETVERRLAGRPPAVVEEASRLVAQGEYERAVQTLAPLFATPPGSWEAYQVMGSAHLGAGRLSMAEEYFNRGLARDSRQARLWIQLALVSQQRGENLVALKRLEEARRIAPESPEVWLNIGYSSDMLGDTSGAVRAYRNFLAFSEGRQEYMRLRTLTVERLGTIER